MYMRVFVATAGVMVGVGGTSEAYCWLLTLAIAVACAHVVTNFLSYIWEDNKMNEFLNCSQKEPEKSKRYAAASVSVWGLRMGFDRSV